MRVYVCVCVRVSHNGTHTNKQAMFGGVAYLQVSQKARRKTDGSKSGARGRIRRKGVKK